MIPGAKLNALMTELQQFLHEQSAHQDATKKQLAHIMTTFGELGPAAPGQALSPYSTLNQDYGPSTPATPPPTPEQLKHQ